MKKNFLLTPGPTPVPAEALLAMARPTIHHRTPAFKAIFKEMNENLKYLFQTKNDIFTFAGSGTSAMEAAAVNLLSPSDKAICVQGGKFGERWTEICRAYQVKVITIDVAWGQAVNPKQIEKELQNNKDVKAVFTTQCETSTGVLTDIEAIAKMMKSKDAVLVTDAVSSLGGVDLQTDNWGVDVVVSGSQKGLMIPPGLAFCSVSKKAWKLVEQSKSPRYYLDFRLAKKALDKSDTAFTPAVTLCIGLNETLNMIKQMTLPVIFEHNRRLARAVRAAVKAIGLELFAQNPADVVTSVYAPQGIDTAQLVKIMRDEYGVSIAGGQGDFKGKIFRIAQMGYMNEFDIIVGISCLEMVLKRMGYEFELGNGLSAAEKELLR